MEKPQNSGMMKHSFQNELIARSNPVRPGISEICVPVLVALLLVFLISGCAGNRSAEPPRVVESMTLTRWPQCDIEVTLTKEEQDVISALLKNARFEGGDAPPPMFILDT